MKKVYMLATAIIIGMSTTVMAQENQNEYLSIFNQKLLRR